GPPSCSTPSIRMPRGWQARPAGSAPSSSTASTSWLNVIAGCTTSSACRRPGAGYASRVHRTRPQPDPHRSATTDMCGIAGIFDTRATRPVDRPALVRMHDSLVHRGPDEDGLHVEPGVGLAHRRLAIIDVSTGQQPLYNEDRTVAIVYNGEIYNYQE